MKQQEAFTLLEMMVTLVIASILAAIAIPAYSDYVTRGRIPEATASLAVKQVQLEQYFQDNRTYVDAPACATDSSTSQYFDFSCSPAATATSYSLLATGKGAMAGFAYSVNQSNQKATASVPSGWVAHSPNNCWITRKGGAC